MTNETELMSCPFCGGEAVINTEMDYFVAGWPHTHAVCCKECDCSLGFSCSGDGEAGGDAYSHTFKTELEAIKAWNTRAAPDGFVLVPVEPTEEMMRAYVADFGQTIGKRSIYKAMIAAAPGRGGDNVTD